MTRGTQPDAGTSSFRGRSVRPERSIATCLVSRRAGCRQSDARLPHATPRHARRVRRIQRGARPNRSLRVRYPAWAVGLAGQRPRGTSYSVAAHHDGSVRPQRPAYQRKWSMDLHPRRGNATDADQVFEAGHTDFEKLVQITYRDARKRRRSSKHQIAVAIRPMPKKESNTTTPIPRRARNRSVRPPVHRTDNAGPRSPATSRRAR